MYPHSLIGSTIGGRYQVEALLGQGGMSAVFRAQDPNLRRPVAVKLIHPHLSVDPNFVSRFKEEAAAVARLRHPNIVQVYDFNVEGGTYYMVMEYLVGETLQARLKRLNEAGRKMPLPEAVNFCAQICDAAGYAHGHELVHRDIKPANIMLDLHGQAILMDFGIVKIIGGEYHTSTGATVGTAMYMSPEQIRSERIDDRSDIYSLGVTLYEMISGRPPYQADSAVSLMMMVLNDPLPDLRQVRPDVPQGLLRVVAKALAKDKSERYPSMAEMAQDLRQIQLQPAGADLSAIKVQPAEGALPAEPPPRKPATLQDQVVLPAVEVSDIKRGASGAAADQGKSPLQTPQRSRAAAPPQLAKASPRRPALKTAQPARKPLPRVAIFAAVALLVLLGGAAAVYFFVLPSQPPALELAPVSPSMVPIGLQTAPYVVNLGTWRIDSYVIDLDFSPDGTLLGSANARDWVRSVKYRDYAALWDLGAGKLKTYLLEPNQWVHGVDFSPDGRLFAASSDDAGIYLWQLPSGTLEKRIESPLGGMSDVEFAPEGLLLAGSSWGGELGLWQVSNGNLLRSLRAAEVGIKEVEFSPDGGLLAACAEDGAITVWKVSDGSLVHTLQGHTAEVTSLKFSLDGSLLASTSADQSVRLWRMSDGSPVQTLTGHAEPVRDVAFSPDGSLLASASEDLTLRLWDPASGELLLSLRGEDQILSLAFSPDGRYLVSGESNGAVQFWGISELIPVE